MDLAADAGKDPLRVAEGVLVTERITWTNEKRRLSDLQPWPRNPRQIRKEQAKRLRESFDQFGQVETIAIGPEGEVYNGHQRLAVLMEQHGPDYEIEVRVSSRPLTEKEREKLTVFLHKGAAGEWNWDELANWDTAELLDWGFEAVDFEAHGFELDGNGEPAEDPGPQVDRAEELREKWQVESGQLWRLGEHRLICGDCTDPAVVERVMGGEKAQLCFTSPPYAQQRDYRDEAKEKVIDWDALMSGMSDCLPMDVYGQVLVNLGLVHRDGEWVPYWESWIEHMRSLGWLRFGWYVWDKLNGMPGDYHGRLWPCHEWIFHFIPAESKHAGVVTHKTVESKHAGVVPKVTGNRKKDGSFTAWTGAGDAVQAYKVHDSVFRLSPAKGGVEGHPAPFPVELPEEAIPIFTNPGAVVYEPFSGSGTTLVACERLGRKCRAVEISPAYVAVALQRWATMTGREPALLNQGTG